MKKKLLYMVMLGAASLMTMSCSDFLTEKNKTDIVKNEFLKDAKEAETVLLGVYATTTQDAMYGMNMSFYLSLGTDCEQVEGNSTENYRIVPTNAYPTTQSEIQQTWKSLYQGVYRANDLLERLSYYYDSYEAEDKDLITIYMAEARALRAMFYFELVRRYGHVPLMTTTTMSQQEPSTFVQADPVKVYEYIEDDLKYAIEILPFAVDDTYRLNNSYRFSKGAAMGLLAKVYATWAGEPIADTSKWELAAETAKNLIKTGKHFLLPDYEKLWYNTCNGIWDPTESLIEISFYSPTTSSGNDPVGRIGKWNGVKTTAVAGVRGACAGNAKVVHTFVLDWRAEDGIISFDANGNYITDAEGNVIVNPAGNKNGLFDVRRDIAVANYRYDDKLSKKDPVLWVKGKNDTQSTAKKNDLNPDARQSEKQNYTPGKWDIQKFTQSGYALINNDKSNVNWYVLRYADVLLIYAEALNEWKHGPTEEAYAAINQVRRRAYGNPGNTSLCDLTPGLDYNDFQKAVRQERAYELAFEGHRRLDLVRWGIYYETIQTTYNRLNHYWWNGTEKHPTANYLVYEFTEKNKHELLPIPQREMDLCKAHFKQNPGWD